ncbi:unnamed protein product [Caretta caretta]
MEPSWMARKENSKNLPKQLLKEQLERQKENQEGGGEECLVLKGGEAKEKDKEVQVLRYAHKKIIKKNKLLVSFPAGDLYRADALWVSGFVLKIPIPPYSAQADTKSRSQG